MHKSGRKILEEKYAAKQAALRQVRGNIALEQLRLKDNSPLSSQGKLDSLQQERRRLEQEMIELSLGLSERSTTFAGRLQQDIIYLEVELKDVKADIVVQLMRQTKNPKKFSLSELVELREREKKLELKIKNESEELKRILQDPHFHG